MGFSKLHSSLVNSSLWTEPDHVRLLFITLLAMADQDGCVYGSRPGFERLAMLDPDACEEMNPWMVLMTPDKNSSDRMRAPENEGRRIEEIPGGFRLLNHAYYRALRNDDDRREQNARAQAKWRAKNKQASAGVSHCQPPSAQAEEEADASSSESSGGTPQTPPSATSSAPGAGSEPPAENQVDDVLRQFPRWWRTDLVAPMHRAKQLEFARGFDAFTDVLDKAYPEVDIYSECAAAYAWEEANNKKTPGGRKRFLRSWMERANDSGRYRKAREIGPYTQGGIPR